MQEQESAMLQLISEQLKDIRQDLREHRAESRDAISTIKKEIKEDILSLNNRLDTEINEIKKDYGSQIETIKTEGKPVQTAFSNLKGFYWTMGGIAFIGAYLLDVWNKLPKFPTH